MMKRQSGVISLLTAVMVSVLIMSVTLPLVYLNTINALGSSDNELSLSAYAAAEGGVEMMYWGAIYGNFGSTTAGSCTSTPANAPGTLYTLLQSTAPSANAITCIKTSTTSSNVTGNLNAGNAYQYVIDPSGQILKDIEVSWMDQSKGDVAFPAAASAAATNYAPAGSVTGPLPTASVNDLPAIELTIVNYVGSSALITPGGPTLPNITVRNVVLLPNSSGSVLTDVLPPAVAKKVGVPCATAASGPQCVVPANSTAIPGSNTAGVPLTASQGSIVYIRALYPDQYPGADGAHFAITFRDALGNTIPIVSPSTTIDVTAHSGPVYRRIVATATPPTQPSVPAGLNYVLFSDTDICKDFNITEAPNGSQLGLLPLCGSTP